MLVVKNKVNTKLSILEIEADMIVFEKDDVESTMYFVIEGSVQIYNNDHGVENKLALVRKHEFFGETEMYTNLPRVNAAKVIEKALLVAIPSQADFENFVSENRWLSGKIMETMSERLAVANDALAAKRSMESTVKIEISDAHKEDKSARRIIRK